MVSVDATRRSLRVEPQSSGKLTVLLCAPEDKSEPRLGRQIVSARKNRQLTKTELANIAGVSRPTIDLLENGRAAEIGYSKLARILAAVDLELKLQAVSPERPTLDDLLKEDSGDD